MSGTLVGTNLFREPRVVQSGRFRGRSGKKAQLVGHGRRFDAGRYFTAGADPGIVTASPWSGGSAVSASVAS